MNIFVLFYVCGVSSALADVVLCDNGYFNGTECVPYTQDKCVAGYIKQDVVGFGVAANGVCGGVATQGKGIYAYSAFDTELCDNGYFNGTECVPYVENTDVCPGGYNQISDKVSFRAVADGLDCPSGTVAISAYDGSHLPDEKQMLVWSYPYDSTPDNMITLRMCGAGQEMNYLGNCANLCAVPGLRYLRSDTGVVVPVYASKITVPSLNIRSGNSQKCYVNLLPESGVGAINVRYNDALYHTVN